MQVKLSKEKLTSIEGAFAVLKENPHNQAGTEIIEKALNECFGCEFDVKVVVPSAMEKELFVMSVYPEVSVVDKILVAVLANKEFDAIKSLWESNKKWTIEIDSRILNQGIIPCNERELTAMLLHEIGHVVYSTSIPNRVSLILRYEVAKTNVRNKMLLRDKVFRTILSLPVLDACVSDGKRNETSIKEEIKADSFVKKMGYEKELSSVLKRLSQHNKYPKNGSPDAKMREVAGFSLQNLEDFQQRQTALAKKHLISLRESCESPYLSDVIDGYIKTVFEDEEDSMSMKLGRKLDYMQERAEQDIEDGYFKEFFIFGKKDLKRIDPAEIDYIDVKTTAMKDVTDKMMIVSYIHSKLDLVEYYISILENPKTARKYNVPYSMDQLRQLQKRLNRQRLVALNYKIPLRNTSLLVSYPTGYEG